MIKSNLPFYLITAAVFLGIAGPALFSEGMFVDGLVYSSISKNLADNLGSFWDLHYTETLYPHFFSHPPLAFGIQSLAFRLLGDGIYTERIYSLVTFLITGWIMVSIWKEITGVNYHKYAWFPLLLWVSIPLVTWAPASNILENTMMVFTSLAVLFFLKSINSNRYLYLLLTGLMIFLGFMTKGPVSLFPLSLPFWFLITERRICLKRFLTDMIIIVAALVIPFMALFVVFPESQSYFEYYYKNQIIRSMDLINVDSRWYIIFRLLRELIPAAVLVLIPILVTLKQKAVTIASRWQIVFFALGMSGVIPIMISSKQSGFYIMATLPVLSIALALFALPRLNLIFERIVFRGTGFRIFSYASYLILFISLVLCSTRFDKIGRDKAKLEDVLELTTLLPENTIILTQESLWTDWSLHGYLQRYGRISMEAYHGNSRQYLLLKKNGSTQNMKDWKLVPLDMNLYLLYEKGITN